MYTLLAKISTELQLYADNENLFFMETCMSLCPGLLIKFNAVKRGISFACISQCLHCTDFVKHNDRDSVCPLVLSFFVQKKTS